MSDQTTQAGAKPEPQIEDFNDNPDLYVIDPSAVELGGPPEANVRTHEILIDGKKVVYKFMPGERMKMPFSHAMKFLKTGFVVQMEDGTDIDPVPETPGIHSTGKFEVPLDQLLARYEELTVDALLMRANALAGGESLNKSSGKKAIIHFLQTDRAKKEAVLRAARNDGVGDQEVEDVEEEGLQRMFDAA